MECWIFVHFPIEHWWGRWISNYKTIFDAWEDGGVRGIVAGRMNFVEEDGTSSRAFVPDPKVYESFGVTPPPEAPHNPEKEKIFREILDNAASRGWKIMNFSMPGGGGGRPHEEDPFGEIAFAAAAQDLANAYPQLHGVIMDGPGEQRYELAHHHGGEVFSVDEADRRFADLGFDIDRMKRGMEHLRKRCQSLTPDMVRYHSGGGTLAGLILFDINEDALYWLRARQEAARVEMQTQRKGIDRVDRKLELGAIPRITSFSSLTGQNYQQMKDSFDYIFPKHYYWHRGFDGMYGTVERWVRRFGKWNPTLTQEDCFALVKSLFGLELPGVRKLVDLEMGFPEAGFSDLVYSETRRALEAIQDDEKVVCWVSTGRSPHAGESMNARDLHGILQASQDAGLKRFLFHPDPDLGASEWHVISQMCGNAWNEGNDYWPTDSWREDIDGYGFAGKAPRKD